MAEAEDQEITGALAKLAEQDAEAASDAEAALEWIAGEQGLRLVTQERIQTFCWYELPMKWLTTLGAQRLAQQRPRQRQERRTAAMTAVVVLLARQGPARPAPSSPHCGWGVGHGTCGSALKPLR